MSSRCYRSTFACVVNTIQRKTAQDSVREGEREEKREGVVREMSYNGGTRGTRREEGGEGGEGTKQMCFLVRLCMFARACRACVGYVVCNGAHVCTSVVHPLYNRVHSYRYLAGFAGHRTAMPSNVHAVLGYSHCLSILVRFTLFGLLAGSLLWHTVVGSPGQCSSSMSSHCADPPRQCLQVLWSMRTVHVWARCRGEYGSVCV